MSYQLIAQIRSAGPARGYPVSIGTFASESEVRAAYRQAMRDLAEGGYSEDVVDFAIGMPPHRSGTRERTAEEANVANALMAQMQLM